MTNRFDFVRLQHYQSAMWRYLLIGVLAVAVAVAVVFWREHTPPADKTLQTGEAGSSTSTLSFGKAAIGGAFTLTDHTGKPFTDANLKGRWSLLYFGFTHCPDICPTGLAAMAQAIDLLGKKGELIQPVFVTLDPERDTQTVLADYVSAFHPRLIGLVGDTAATATIAAAYKVYYSKVEQPESALGYLIDHSGYLYLMNPEGDYAAHFPHDMTAKALAAALQPLLDGSSR